MRSYLAATTAALVALVVGGSAAAVDPEPQNPSGRGGPYFVKMDPMVTPIVGPAKIEGSLEVKFVLEAASAAEASALSVKMPELRDATYLAALECSRLHASGYLPVDAQRFSADVTAAVRTAHPGVARVLVQEISALPG